MSSPHDAFREGRLDEAIEATIAIVKKNPADADARLALFVYLCFRGELERALIHLDTLVTLEGETKGGASIYHSLVSAEYERKAVFESRGEPSVPPGEFAGIHDRLEALRLLRGGDTAGGCAALERSNEAAADRAGKLDQREFDSLCDYDDLLGNVLEVYAGGRYVWMPFEAINEIKIEAPKTPLDLLWISAEIDRSGGEVSNVHLPTLYPGTALSEDPETRLGRATNWLDLGDDLYRGAGQKMFFASSGDEVIEVPILETRSIQFNTAPR